MDELQQILENSKLTKQKINDNLLHPVLDTTDYKPREIFAEISDISDNYFNKKSAIRMVGLAGLRGTGKTTLLWQSANYIFDNYTQNIYFFNFADLIRYNISIWDIREGFEKFVVKNYLASYKERIVLIFDEVHESPMWAKALKALFDEFRSAFILASGSSALLLQATADLVSRMLIQHVFPLNFTEYITIRKKKSHEIFDLQTKLKDCLFYSDTANKLFNSIQSLETGISNYFLTNEITNDDILNYVKFHNITRLSLETNEERIDSLISDLIKRVIYEDIPKLSEKQNDAQNSEKILQRIAASDEINLQTLSQTIGISQNEINDNLNILSKAELLNILRPFGGIDTKINKAQKFFFMSPSIRRVLLKPLTGNKNEIDLLAKM
ncbi:MAG: AAA family ATPase, partial [Bacteroidales bacterium]|nr:AAA family ATPase [Bacteroidales bacterium]